MPLAVACHHLSQARAALAQAERAGGEIDLLSARGAAAYAGVGFLHAMERALGRPLIVDCGADAGIVMGALRQGLRRLVFTGDSLLLVRLRDMGDQLGATIGAARPDPLLELEPGDDAARALAQFLAGTVVASPGPLGPPPVCR